MRTCLVVVLLFTIIMTSTSFAQKLEEPEIFTDILTLERTIGGESSELSGEFILVRPRSMDVSPAGDIVVFDENRLKVYSTDGSGSNVFGGLGDGPGEFSRLSQHFVGPTGMVTVLDLTGIKMDEWHLSLQNNPNKSYNVFDNKGEFIYKRRIGNGLHFEDNFSEAENIQFVSMNRLYAISKTEMIYEVFLSKYLSPQLLNRVIIYENNSECIEIFKGDGFFNPSDMSGAFRINNLLWEVTPDNRIVYINTLEDRLEPDGESEYFIHINEIGKDNNRIIRYIYVPIPDNNERTNKYKTKKYNPAAEWLKVDGRYAFVFTFKANHNDPILTDVFDINTGEYLSSVYFPFVPACIRNGLAYEFYPGTSRNYAYISIYRIDPSVYGK
ncbi:hypothetical protein ACFL7D_03200 [candidate division KSB1 bacterium]